MIETISNFTLFRDSLLLFPCLEGTVSLPCGGSTSTTKGGTRRSRPQEWSKWFQFSTTTGAWLNSNTYLSILAIQANRDGTKFFKKTSSVPSAGSRHKTLGERALPLPSVSSCFQKCLSQKGWIRNITAPQQLQKQIPVHVSRTNMQLQDSLERLGGNSNSAATCTSNSK